MSGGVIVSKASAGGPPAVPLAKGPALAKPQKSAPVKIATAPRGSRGSNPYGVSPAVYRQALDLANLQTQGPLTELAKQIANNNANTAAQTKLVGGYYNQFGDFAKQGAQNAAGLASGLNATLGGIANQENQQLGQADQSQVDALNKYTPPGMDNSLGMQGLQQEIARGSGIAAQNEGAYRAFGATVGANQAGLANSELGVGALAGTQALRGISQAGQLANEPLQSKIAALQAQKGALLGTDINNINNSNVKNAILEQTLGVNQGRLAEQVRNDTLRNQATVRGQNVTLRGQNINRAINQQRIDATIRGQNLAHLDRQSANAIRQAALNLRSRGGGTKPLTTHQNDSALGVLGKLETAVQSYRQSGIPTTKKAPGISNPDDQQIRDRLVALDPLGGLLVDAALQLTSGGAITPATARALHQAGIRGGMFKGAPIKVGRGVVGATKSATAGASNAVLGALGL